MSSRRVSRGRAQSGQMAVEFAIVLPVVLVVLVIAIDAMVYLGECARFDQLAAQSVLAQAVSPSHEANADAARVEAVRATLAEQFTQVGEDVRVSSADAGGVLASRKLACTCTLEYAPWPLAKGQAVVFGVRIPTALTHERTLVIDPYTPGEL